MSLLSKKDIKRIGKNLIYGPRIRALRKAAEQADTSRESLVSNATGFVMSCHCANTAGFSFLPGGDQADLYSTAYGVSYLGLIGRLDLLSRAERDGLVAYFDRHQDDDGLYRDPGLVSPQAEHGQGWGWPHLLPHVLIALDYLDVTPAKPLDFVYLPFAGQTPEAWLEDIFSQDHLMASNAFMNTLIALLYARDFMGDARAADLVTALHDHAVASLLPKYALPHERVDTIARSRLAKTLYHLLPSIVYERDVEPRLKDAIIRLTLATRNSGGGFGTSIVSDACEDMDSVYNLCVLTSSSTEAEVREVLEGVLGYLPINQNADGGFVFRRFMPFRYGQCNALSSETDQGNMFGTWFRMLSYAFGDETVRPGQAGWKFSRVPGYQWYKRR